MKMGAASALLFGVLNAATPEAAGDYLIVDLGAPQGAAGSFSNGINGINASA